MSEQDWEEWAEYWWNELLNRIIEEDIKIQNNKHGTRK